MAEEKNIYLVRLNKLYHFLNDQNATVNIKYTHDGEQYSKKFTADSENSGANKKGNGDSISDLFSQGCEVNGRALKDIIGKRSYIESKQIGRYQNITEHQKDVIKSIQYRFKGESLEVSTLDVLSSTKKDLYQNKNFFEYNFFNVLTIYRSITEDIKSRVVELLTNRLDEIDDWVSGPFNKHLEEYSKTFDSTVKVELNEILDFWVKNFDTNYVNTNNEPNFNFLPGIEKYFHEKIVPPKEVNKIYGPNLEMVGDYFSDKANWFASHRYGIFYDMEDKLIQLDYELWPKYTHAMILLLQAEYSVIHAIISDTAIDEALNNIEFSVRYSSSKSNGELVYEHGLSYEELSIILEEYNFRLNLEKALEVNSNAILDSPIDRYSSSVETDFLYNRSTIEYLLKEKLIIYFKRELKKHFYLHDESEDEYLLKKLLDIRRSIISKYGKRP